ncbi:MAG TPA: TonB-dependent receptor [Vicinamibacterales bacterium]|nr:TonB-dependent receptor [Vicinamibacterales bacterium]
MDSGSVRWVRQVRWVLCTLILLLFTVAAAHAQPATLAGTVKSSDGAPIPGARVTVMSAQKPTVGITDANGKFSIPDVTLPADIEVTARGFEVSRLTVTVSTVELILSPAVVTQSVVVTPDREASFRDPSTGTTVLSRSDLDQLPVVTTDEALKVVSGFSLFRRSSARASNPTTHGVTLRGLSASGSSRGLVLLDGVPLNDGFGGWVTWTRVPPDAISRIDVDRGAEGEAVGTDALGGLIRIVTPAAGNTTFQIGGEGGTPGVGGLDFAIAGRLGRAAGFGSGSWYHTDGVIPVAPESRGPVDQPANATWSNLYGRVVFGQGTRRLTAVGWGGSDNRGNGTVIQVNRMSGGTGAVAYEATTGSMTFAGRLSVSPNRFYQTFSTVNAARTSEVLTSAQTTDGTTTRGVVEAGRGIGRGQILASYQLSHAGVDFEDARPTTTSTQKLRDDSHAIALQAGAAPMMRLSVSGGVRHEWRAAPTSADSYDQATVGRANATFELTRTTFLRGSAASSHRWPTLNELVRNFQAGNVLTRANPNLLPERARSADVGIGTSGAKWQLSASGFWTVVHDAIANVTVSTGALITRERRNAGDAHARGLELDGELRPTPELRLRVSGAFTDARFRDSLEPALEGNRLPQVPKASGSATIDWLLPHGIMTSVLWHGVTPQFDDDRNQFLLAKASQLDLQVAARLAHIRWLFALENAFDSRVEVGRTPLVTLAPGRAVRLGATWIMR